MTDTQWLLLLVAMIVGAVIGAALYQLGLL